MNKTAVLFILLFASFDVDLNAGNNADTLPGWYITYVYADSGDDSIPVYEVIYNFRSDGLYEAYGLGWGGESRTKGTWQIKTDTLLLTYNWDESSSVGICTVGPRKEFVPWTDTFRIRGNHISETDTSYAFNFYLARWNPAGSGNTPLEIYGVYLLKRFAPEIRIAGQIPDTLGDVYFAWHGSESHEALCLKKNGKFVFYNDRALRKKSKGSWRMSGDTLVLHVEHSKVYQGTEANPWKTYKFIYSNGTLRETGLITGERGNYIWFLTTKKLFRKYRKEFR
jgi:hypothetical protein